METFNLCSLMQLCLFMLQLCNKNLRKECSVKSDNTDQTARKHDDVDISNEDSNGRLGCVMDVVHPGMPQQCGFQADVCVSCQVSPIRVRDR